MSSNKLIIRTASAKDAPALLSIYAPYVEHTAITFEYEVPSLDEFRQRILHTLQQYPYLIAERAMPALFIPVQPTNGQWKLPST